MKFKLFILSSFLFLCAFFHTQIVGGVARYLVLSKFGCELAYRSVYWEGGDLVFSDVVVFDPSFDAHIVKATLHLDWGRFPKKMQGHVHFERPHVSLLQKRAVPEWKKGWFDFTVSIHDGIVGWDGPAHFDIEHTALATTVRLDWGDSGLSATVAEGKIEGELKRCKASLLRPFFPEGKIEQGRISGHIQAGLDHTLYSAHLKIEQLGLSMGAARLEGVEGTVSYNAQLGAKWELQGCGGANGERFPLTCQGRGFFKSRWIESQIEFGQAFCKISGEDVWKVECHDLLAAQVTLLQAPLALVFPKIADWVIAQGVLNGNGTFAPTAWETRFAAEHLVLRKGDFALACHTAQGDLTQDGGTLNIQADDFGLQLGGTWAKWQGEVRLFSGALQVKGGWDGEKCPLVVEKGRLDDLCFTGNGWVDSHFDFSFGLQGEWAVAQRKIPFYCPRLERQGAQWLFDFRLARQTWDVLRIGGSWDGKEMVFDAQSHCLGAPLHFAPSPWGVCDVSLKLPWASLLAAGPWLQEWGIDVGTFPFLGETDLRFQYGAGPTKISAKGSDFALQIEQAGKEWKIDLASDLTVNGWVDMEGRARGSAQWREVCHADFEGKISPTFQGEFSLPRVWCDLAHVPLHGIAGIAEGQGHLLYAGDIQADFDVKTSMLRIDGHAVENEGIIHLSYCSKEGLLLRGVNLHGPLNCMVDLLAYDAIRSHWVFHHAQVYLPGALFAKRYLPFLDPQNDLNFVADLDFASDFSTFVCTMREGDIPFGNASHHVEDVHLYRNKNECKAALHYQGHLYRFSLNLADPLAGRLILGEEEDPLTIDWEYGKELVVHTIEGSFMGVEASFHEEGPNTLIGSARLNLTTLSPFLPPSVAEVFNELKMGKGYELKGRLAFEKNRPHFQGILAGKQLELFGFQFRTLLAQVDLGPEAMHFTNVKISDTAGIMKIDAIDLEGKGEDPWTIAIPQLTILELRPSLLLRPGGEVGPISPLVVRELHLTDFKGLLDEGKTYTAKGSLRFINSYKREETVFDIPANVLSRIVGIDLDLLIPVRGDLTFDLKDGLFRLRELTHAYSEGDRSEFFLEMDPPPTMDLDGHLQIFIKMKQFVLLKITESFLISIEGKLNDPQFHLQKKRFFGLL